MMFRIRFNLLGGCFACNCSAAVFNRSCRIGSGIHFRAVGLLTPKSRAHFDTLPPGCSLYQASTLACCVGAPLQNAEKRLSAGFLLITAAGSHRQQKRHLPGTHGRVFAGQVSCVRRESAAVNGQEQNGLIAQTL